LFIVLVLVSSQSVIETVNVGLGAAWINYSGRSPLDSTGTQAVRLSNVMRWVRGTVVGSMGCGYAWMRAAVSYCGRWWPRRPALPAECYVTDTVMALLHSNDNREKIDYYTFDDRFW